MFSYYKKVFLFPIRFGFLGAILGSVGPFLGSIGSSFLTGAAGAAGSSIGSSITGGSGDDSMAAAVAEKQKEKDFAGREAETSLDKVEFMGTSVARNIGEFGHQMAGDFMKQLSSKFVSNTVEGIFNKPVDPRKQGMRQRAFTSAAFPGVNPWELSGGSAGGGSGGVGGTAAPSIGARAQRQSADIAARPKLEEVSIKYQKAPHEIDVLKAHGGVLKEEESLISAKTIGQKNRKFLVA